jgi:hypothetical protein
MSETLFYNPGTTIATDTIATGNISVNLDLLDQWLYLRPSVSNAATIVAGMSRFANTYGRSVFGMNVISTQLMSYGNLYGTMTSTAIYGTTYMPGGYVFQVDGNGVGQCAVFSSKENTVTNYAVAGTGGNGTHCGCLLPDCRALIIPIGTGNPRIQIWNNITRTSTSITLPSNIRIGNHGGTLSADGSKVIMLAGGGANIVALDTTTFSWSNLLAFNTNDFGNNLILDVTGNVIIAPQTTSGVGVYSPITNVLTRIAPTGGTPSAACWGSANAGDGRVVFGPFNQNNDLYVYNPFTLTCTRIAYTWGGTAGSIRIGTVKSMPDGRVLLVPWGGGGSYFGIFDPYTNSITTFTPTLPTGQISSSMLGGNFVPDGRFILANTTGISNVPLLNFTYRSIPEAWCVNPLIQNHGR